MFIPPNLTLTSLFIVSVFFETLTDACEFYRKLIAKITPECNRVSSGDRLRLKMLEK